MKKSILALIALIAFAALPASAATSDITDLQNRFQQYMIDTHSAFICQSVCHTETQPEENQNNGEKISHAFSVMGATLDEAQTGLKNACNQLDGTLDEITCRAH